MKKVLFILKHRHYSPARGSYGLINSASQVAAFLTEQGNLCKVVSVIDSNSIDREVTAFDADLVIIEALWVSAHKLAELMMLHRHHHRRWAVRIHSDIGYLSEEGNGIKYINDYIELGRGLVISFNNASFNKAMTNCLDHPFVYLPNVITFHEPLEDYTRERSRIHIGCFGALRILKNQCFQALCAIEAANKMHKKLMFHITPHLTSENDPVFRNLVQIFETTEHELVIHPWMDTDKFHKLISKMDLGLQLSYTESFNIVAADFISKNKLLVASQAIDWMPEIMQASTTNYEQAVAKIIWVYHHRNDFALKQLTRTALMEYNREAKRKWHRFMQEAFHHHRDD